ncbi:Retrovirus-related Pol polyprotein from transposon TNT 1-94, partial [Linum perenne]
MQDPPRTIQTCSTMEEVESGRTIGSTEVCEGLYVLRGKKPNWKKEGVTVRSANAVASSSYSENQVMLWHFRLGHPSFGYLEKLYPHLFANKSSKFYKCEICQYAKHTRSVYSGTHYKPSHPFAIIHSDIWGPNRVKSLNGARWFVTFIDDHTRMTWTYLMRDKSETTNVFKNFHTLVQTQFATKIQVLRTDNAKDYFNSMLGQFLTQEGIVHCSSCVDTPQQNGIA